MAPSWFRPQKFKYYPSTNDLLPSVCVLQQVIHPGEKYDYDKLKKTAEELVESQEGTRDFVLFPVANAIKTEKIRLQFIVLTDKTQPFHQIHGIPIKLTAEEDLENELDFDDNCDVIVFDMNEIIIVQRNKTSSSPSAIIQQATNLFKRFVIITSFLWISVALLTAWMKS